MDGRILQILNYYDKAVVKYEKSLATLKAYRKDKEVGGKLLYESTDIKDAREDVQNYEEKMYRLSGILYHIAKSTEIINKMQKEERKYSTNDNDWINLN